MNRSNPDGSILTLSTAQTNRYIQLLAAHPYLCALFFCLLLNPFYLGSAGNVPHNALMLEVLAVISAGAVIVWKLFRRGALGKKTAAAAGILWIPLVLFGAWLYAKSTYPGLWMLLGGSVILLVLFFLTRKQKHNQTQRTALLLLGISFLLKFYYVYYTSVYQRQHDVGSFGGDIGHTGYMEYILFHHSLPDFDPRGYWQFYHPPLHHAISAVWIGLSENLLGVGHDPARESLQTLTLFYAMAIVITAYRILRHFKLDGMALYAPLLLIAFHPSFILLSGSINNDTLSVVFIMGAVLCTLKWYENQTIKGILKIALCIGLGMMTKISAAIVAIPVAVVFLIVLIQKLRQKEWRIFGQFGSFAAVCVPLGLWYPVRNLVKFGVPLTYVQELSPGLSQYLGNQSFLSRITDFSPKQVQNVFEQWLQGDGSGYNEYNPLIALLKNSLFGEYINEGTFPEGSPMPALAVGFFWLGVVLAAAAFVCMIVFCFRKCSIPTVPKVFFVLFHILLLMNLYYLAASSPFTCSMNFRYITPTCIIGALFLGVTIQELRRRQKPLCKSLAVTITALSSVFAACAFVFYIYVGMAG